MQRAVRQHPGRDVDFIRTQDLLFGSFFQLCWDRTGHGPEKLKLINTHKGDQQHSEAVQSSFLGSSWTGRSCALDMPRNAGIGVLEGSCDVHDVQEGCPRKQQV